MGRQDSPGTQGGHFGAAVVITGTSDHFLLRLREQEKADAKENADDCGGDEPDQNEVEQDAGFGSGCQGAATQRQGRRRFPGHKVEHPRLVLDIGDHARHLGGPARIGGRGGIGGPRHTPRVELGLDTALSELSRQLIEREARKRFAGHNSPHTGCIRKINFVCIVTFCTNHNVSIPNGTF
jgi:hypothetical protein